MESIGINNMLDILSEKNYMYIPNDEKEVKKLLKSTKN